MEGLKLLFTFALILLLLQRRLPLGPVMMGGSALLALLYHSSPSDYFVMVWQGIKNPVTIELVFILLSIMILEHFLGLHGYLNRMLVGLQGLIKSRRVIMALLPAFIGLMPSAGGARFSAPLVDYACSGQNITPEQKSFVNFYYRHTSEYFLPVYPGVVLTAHLSGLPLQKLIVSLVPYGLIVVFLGIPMLCRLQVTSGEPNITGNRNKMAIELFIGTLPVLVIIFLVLIIQVEVGIAVGLMLLALLVYHKYTPSKLWNLCCEAVNLKTIALVFGVMIFKQVLEDTSAVNDLPPLLAKLPVSEFIVFAFISFFTGMLTGLMVATIGISFPIAMVAMGGDLSLSLTVLLFIAGFTGTMLTPMHLCLPLTLDFFKADLNKVLRMLIGPEVALLAIAFAAYILF